MKPSVEEKPPPGWYLQDGTSRMAPPAWYLQDGTSRMAPPEWHLQHGTSKIAPPGWHFQAYMMVTWWSLTSHNTWFFSLLSIASSRLTHMYNGRMVATGYYWGHSGEERHCAARSLGIELCRLETGRIEEPRNKFHCCHVKQPHIYHVVA